MQRLICWLLWRANTRPIYKEGFYRLKEHLLQKHGSLVGKDYQHIVKKCWSCDGTGVYPGYWGGEECYRCVRGVFDEFWVELERWEWCGRIFHRPVGRIAGPPMMRCNIIEGYIQHDEQKHVREAFLWLTLIYDRALWWKAMRMSWERSWMPLCLLNRFVFWCRYNVGRIRQMSWGVDERGRKTGGQAWPTDDIPF